MLLEIHLLRQCQHLLGRLAGHNRYSVSVRDNKIINIEGNPESPISRGTLCPKGAATYQLAVNPLRIAKVLYRPKGGTAWEEKPLDWAMDRIA